MFAILGSPSHGSALTVVISDVMLDTKSRAYLKELLETSTARTINHEIIHI